MRRTLASAAAAVVVTGAALALPASPPAPEPCMALQWSDAVAVAHGDQQAAQHRWDGLIRDGWYGSPADGLEALWSPPCTDADIAADSATLRALA